MRLAIATRSMNDFLYQASGELLGLDGVNAGVERFRLTGTDNFGYFRELLRLDADWAVSIDEDAFLLDPQRLRHLVQVMDQRGYAACGMPDGGAVRIRHHNPAACNALFNVFDLRRVRRVWQDWQKVAAATHRPEYEHLAAPFARRTAFAFDHFERYYGVFFSLHDAGERILFLDAQEWSDGVSTLLEDASGEPLLIHCWYTRNWASSHHTRQRYRTAIEYARQRQGLGPSKVERAEQLPPDPLPAESNAHRWDAIYQDAGGARPSGDTLTYEKAARFLEGLSEVEDWGCGWAWFRRHLPECVHYRGIDGSASPGADEVVDLANYTSRVEGILLRHVLEHNHAWQRVLDNALRSFTRRMVLVLFTPFVDVTWVIATNTTMGVPDIAFAKTDLIRRFTGLKWTLDENLPTRTQYGVEHVFYLEKP
jgi:hypothetical protein